MTRPLCPACLGTRVMGDKHPRPCTCCEDGHMRGIDDPTPEERRIAELEAEVARLRAKYEPTVAVVPCLQPDSDWRAEGCPCAACRNADGSLFGGNCPTPRCDLAKGHKTMCITTNRGALKPGQAGFTARAESDRLGGGA